MKIETVWEEDKLILKIGGRIDTTTAPQLQKTIEELLCQREERQVQLELDLLEVNYISSAGLRVLLAASKQMKENGGMKVTHVNETVMEVFTATGFTNILTIQSSR